MKGAIFGVMPKPPKRPRDQMQLAREIGLIAVGERDDETGPEPNEKAVRRGKARAEKLSPGKRKAIAKKAAKARWTKRG